MNQLGLVRTTTVGAARVVSAEWENPACTLLVQLFQLESFRAPEPLSSIRETLAAFGAPLMGVERKAHCPLETALVKGLRAAKSDGTLLRVLPVVLVRNRHRLDWVDLAERARAEGLKAELGLLLDLTGRLLNDEELRKRGQGLRDRRRTSMRYFPEPRNRYERQLAEASSPPVAKDWGFHMNMSENSFRSLLAESCPELTLA
ncbi:MAG: hypothetical protein ACLGIN_14135 [Candidatus Sericytochromatia bacterium]